MINFENGSVFKLSRTEGFTSEKMIRPLMAEGETFLDEYKSVRDVVVFTNKRIICVNVQGMTGMKKDFTSIPYSSIQLFSVETAGPLDVDSELQVYLAGIGQIAFEFTGFCNVTAIAKTISSCLFS